MITVTVAINNQVVMARSARQIEAPTEDLRIYLCDDGARLRHSRSDGAAELARQMLKGVVNIDEK